MVTKNIKFILFAVGLLFSFSVFADSKTDSLLRQKNDPVGGNPKGDITVVEFFDYECSHCANMVSRINSVMKQSPNVRFVFKEFPIRGPESELAARAALAANIQGKYLQFNRAIFSTDSAVTENSIAKMAKVLGLNVAKLKKDMTGSTVTKQIQDNHNLARDLDVNGTPTFFIAKTNAQSMNEVNSIPGEITEEELQEAIAKAKS